MEATHKERELSRVACLLDELQGKKKNQAHWDGYHPMVYGKAVQGDALITELCAALQTTVVEKQSLEMHMWWRDHQEEDAKKARATMKLKKTAREKARAMAKLTPYERRLLGIAPA